MTPERYQQITRLYQEAAEMDAGERVAYLDLACAGDAELRRTVESLLGLKTSAENFIETPALDVIATRLAVEQSKITLGKRLGKYSIISLLGAGGMGQVYLAEDSQLRRRVALKALPTPFTFDKERLKRFQTEARAAAGLNHPHIATVHTVEEIDGQHFITMEYVSGQTLNRCIPEGGLTLPPFFDLFLPLTDALTHAHDRGIIHRDIKPGNIILTEDGAPKILDFGLARIHQSVVESEDTAAPVTLTGEGLVMGTPAYMSPEQAQGERGDHRSDIFSLGVVMYEALTGERPFKGDSPASIISNLLKEEPPPVTELKPGTPPLLGRVIKRCLRKDPRQRYQTMREVRAVLEEARNEEGAFATTAPAGDPRTSRLSMHRSGHLFGRLFERPRLRALAMVALLALAAGAGGWAALKLFRGEARTITRFAVQPPPGQQASLSEANISPDGRHLVFASRRGDLTQLYVRPLDQFEARPLAGTDNARRPFFSPDGNWVAFFADNALKKVPLTGGTPLTICDGCQTAFENDWGENDSIVFSDTGGLYRVSANGGQPERLTTVDESQGEKTHRAPQLLPGGRGLLFSVQTANGWRAAVRPRAGDVAGGAWRYLQNLDEAAYARYVEPGYLVFARSNQLLAAPFDAARLEVTGTPVTVLGGVFAAAPNFKIAGDGTLMYLPEVSMRENTLAWVDRRGQATPLLPARANYRAPRLSPDGSRVAVQVDQDIWVYEVETGKGLRLTFEGDNQSPVWTPDGRHVIYASNRKTMWHIYRQAADGTGNPERWLASEHRHVPYAPHSSGKGLGLVAIYSATNSDILMLSDPDSKPTPLADSPFIEDTPRFSPDGRWLAYFSMEAGHSEVYVRPHGDAGGKVQVSDGGGMFPVWSPAGREIFYRRANTFYAVDVTTSPRFAAGTPRALFEGNFLIGFDVAADGQRFLMVRNEQGSMPTQIHVVLNWTDELPQ